MLTQPAVESVPLESGTDGVIRVVGTRIPLATVVGEFLEGATAEEIVQQYSSLRLADVYAILTHYLRHRDEIDAYLSERSAKADDIRLKCSLRADGANLRARLLARNRE